jgi:hypothetical protein
VVHSFSINSTVQLYGKLSATSSGPIFRCEFCLLQGPCFWHHNPTMQTQAWVVGHGVGKWGCWQGLLNKESFGSLHKHMTSESGPPLGSPVILARGRPETGILPPRIRHSEALTRAKLCRDHINWTPICSCRKQASRTKVPRLAGLEPAVHNNQYSLLSPSGTTQVLELRLSKIYKNT